MEMENIQQLRKLQNKNYLTNCYLQVGLMYLLHLQVIHFIVPFIQSIKEVMNKAYLTIFFKKPPHLRSREAYRFGRHLNSNDITAH
jgi:hypothetical protein